MNHNITISDCYNSLKFDFFPGYFVAEWNTETIESGTEYFQLKLEKMRIFDYVMFHNFLKPHVRNRFTLTGKCTKKSAKSREAFADMIWEIIKSL